LLPVFDGRVKRNSLRQISKKPPGIMLGEGWLPIVSAEKDPVDRPTVALLPQNPEPGGCLPAAIDSFWEAVQSD